ncbi:aminopeptidase C [Coriobacterium glomerans PW2]|uniref:Aminopeptidase n=1 Tax=Coriobacterium glomerans (strain ATCC 49209 / DSM 20642 / JCM 10262 / PW2) TaxID=700015 RepID=F2N831_CORGP|nr:C1 family peptidase [Coriobacterium glomerans]AEB07214.1 aminopeptidase C [Coriobacterium glomerans PW2]
MDSVHTITPADIERAQRNFDDCRCNAIARNAVTGSGVRAVAADPAALARATTTFDIQLEQGDITNQRHSGRCWMFASLNTMRFRVMRKLGLKTFELSETYPLFWDKFERSNWFFENIIATVDAQLTSREVSYLLADPIGDGGQWDMFRALVKKYGVVPKEAMPETALSGDTGDLRKYLTRYLRHGAKRIRDAAASGSGTEALTELKKELMDGVYRILVITLGEPPKTFDVRIRDERNELKASGTYTPKEFFAEFVDMDLDAYISLINAPTDDKPYMRSYTVKYLGNVIEDGSVRYVNLPIEVLKRVAVAQLRDGLPVWFGSDVDQGFLRKEGVLDPGALDVDSLFRLPIEEGLDKAGRLDYGESLMTHAMTIQGVNLDSEGEPTRWRIENSWGDDRGKKGYDIASTAWFDEYVYQVVVDRRYLSDEEIAAYDCDPIELAPWDPMGALAD